MKIIPEDDHQVYCYKDPVWVLQKYHHYNAVCEDCADGDQEQLQSVPEDKEQVRLFLIGKFT